MGIFFFDNGAFAEQKGNAPDACQSNEGINNPADNGVLAAKDPGDDIKTENTDRTPVDCADNRQQQREFV